MSDYKEGNNENINLGFSYLELPCHPYLDSTSCIAMPNPQQAPIIIGPQKNSHPNSKCQDIEQIVIEENPAVEAPKPAAYAGIGSAEFNKRRREQFREVWRLAFTLNIHEDKAAELLGYEQWKWG